MMAQHNTQKTIPENRVGLHYSRFLLQAPHRPFSNQRFAFLKNLEPNTNPTRIREVGLTDFVPPGTSRPRWPNLSRMLGPQPLSRLSWTTVAITHSPCADPCGARCLAHDQRTETIRA